MANPIEEFTQRWADHGDEKQETQRFWIDLLAALGVPDPTQKVEFERRTAGGGFIDALFPDARLLVEQKSAGIDLDKPEPRQGVAVTPVEQALRYANALPPSVRPTTLCVCNFQQFRLYDLEQHPLADHGPQAEFTLQQLPERYKTLQRLFSEENSRITVEQRLSENAGVMVARLHNVLAEQYDDPDRPANHHALSILTVRIVFCLYAEDAGLFPSDAFSNYVAESTTDRLRRDLVDLFRVLDTPTDKRDPYLEHPLADFPYVNGGLFREPITIPPMTDPIRDALLSAGSGFDWSQISPVIFGSLMEETLSHDQRRAGGMHYTTVRNIHRLIDPLFLDDLKAELHRIETDKTLTDLRRRNQLTRFQDKLASMQFLDPACGSGNFLTETFLQLRELENRAIAGRLNGQGYMEFGDDDAGSLVKVRIDQMHGIEINDFAVCVARTALWIAEQQALDDTETIAEQTLPHLPLHDSGNIVCANSLRYDWNDVLPGDDCDYVMGNPPFVGRNKKSDAQISDMELIWGDLYEGNMDYVTAWFKKTEEYLQNSSNAEFAFVSTNSISQGIQVADTFEPLLKDWRIKFAYRTFAWDAQSTDVAHVHVVIIGMERKSKHTESVTLFESPDSDGHQTGLTVKNINAYLTAAPDVFVRKRSQKEGPLSPLLSLANFGSMPRDGGHLLIESAEEHDEIMKDPIAAKYVHPFIGSRELINDGKRWCLWLVDATPAEMKHSPCIWKRISKVRKMREASKAASTREMARTAWLFGQVAQPDSNYLAIPSTFSARREYATCDWYSPETIASNALYTCVDPQGFSFAIIESRMFMAWQKGIGGRLKSDCRFTNTVVWNTLPLPEVDADLRRRIVDAGRGVLAARAAHAGQSLADLYDPDVMPVDLRKAHEELDRLVDRAFGADRWLRADDDARLRLLLEGYARLSAARRVDRG